MSQFQLGKVGGRRDLEKCFRLPDIVRPPEAAMHLSKPHAKARLGNPEKAVNDAGYFRAGRIKRRSIFIGYPSVALHWQAIVKISTQSDYQGSTWTSGCQLTG